MEWLFGVDWAKTFLPNTPLLEIFLRGSLTYLALFFLLRIVLKRESGGMGVTDLLVIVLIADAAQNAMAETTPRSPTASSWWRRSFSGATPSTGSASASPPSSASSIRGRSP